MSMHERACARCGAYVSIPHSFCRTCRNDDVPDARVSLPNPTMFADPTGCRSTVSLLDYPVLMAYLASSTEVDAFTRSLLTVKLATCEVVRPDDLPPHVATLNSQITFRVGRRAPERRLLVNQSRGSAAGITLSVTTPLGVALVGARVGGYCVVLRRNGSREVVDLEAVTFQPEAELKRTRSN